MTQRPEVLAARVQGVLDVPLHRWLGVSLADPADVGAGLVLPVGSSALGNADLMHGGIMTALLDVVAYLRLLPSLDDDVDAVTHGASVSLLRSVRGGSTVLLRADLLRCGQSLAFLRSEATVDGDVVAFGQVTKSLVRPG